MKKKEKYKYTSTPVALPEHTHHAATFTMGEVEALKTAGYYFTGMTHLFENRFPAVSGWSPKERHTLNTNLDSALKKLSILK